MTWPQAQDCLAPPKARRSRKESPWDLWGECGPADTFVWTFGLLNQEKIHFGCFKRPPPPSPKLSLFGTVTLRYEWGLPNVSVVKDPPANAGDLGSIPESGRSSRGGNGNPLQYSCLENPMDRGAWRATDHGVQRVRHNWVTTTTTNHQAFWLRRLSLSKLVSMTKRKTYAFILFYFFTYFCNPKI